MTTVNKSDKDRVVIFDTTLRDGEQCPGATMSFEEKLEIAEMLDDMGVDVIEAGFPITSEGDFQAVSEIARRSKNAVIAGLSRAHPKDIDRCAEAVKFAKLGRVHTLIERVPNSDKAVFSVHCHNDLGMAVANSLAGIAGGAQQIECTINGIGERAGNAALEGVVMAINVRNDKFPWWNKIDTTQLTRASKLVSAATSFP